MKYPFEKHFLVCTGARCNNEERGDERSENIRNDLKELNKEMGRRQTVRVCSVSCLDLCDHGPNMIAYPSGTVYSHLDRASAVRAYEGEIGDGEIATDKVLDAAELERLRKK
jgi:hypothetical protein